MRARPSLLFLSALALSWTLASSSSAAEFKGAEAVSAQRVQAGIGYLASDELEGRGSGAKGGRLAGDWLATQCREIGLKPAGSEGYFQPFRGQDQALRNVVAEWAGDGSSDEAIVIGAHYDHLGLGYQQGSLDFGRGRGKIHNGADDNASGTVAVLEIARAFAATQQRFKRRVIFAWFDGEERGLLGSRHWVRSPSISGRVALMINLDMVGRLDEEPLSLAGVKTGDLLAGWVERANAELRLPLKQEQGLNANSDHDPFYKRGVPVLVPFTGLHEDYHRPSDDAEFVNVAGVVKIARFAYGVAVQAADAERAPRYQKVPSAGLGMLAEQFRLLFGNRKRQGRAKLGVTMADDGVTVEVVRAGSIAARAGLRVGDRIRSLDGRQIGDFEDLREAVGAARGAVSIELTREGQPLTVVARFPGRKPQAQPDQPQPESGERWF
ncbi:MAG TPA: hypothetical protein DEA08_31900 [Planctomycetes bacterium]|nr:hypothetical protein [Planctomycetota bacterium]